MNGILNMRSTTRQDSLKDNDDVNIIPFLKSVSISRKKWDYLVDLCKKNGQDLEEYLAIPIEQEIDNLLENPCLMRER